MKKIGALLLATGLLWSCGKSPNPMGSVEGQMGESTRLTKQAVPAALMATIRVTQSGAPISNATVELAKSVSGVAANYQWSGTTDVNGQATIEGVMGGYYLIRVTDSGGSMIGHWTSVPVNDTSTIWLPVGAPAQVTQGTAQKTSFKVRIENITPTFMFTESGVFHTPDGASGPSPAFPGGSFTFHFSAEAGARLSFATMFAQSNDWFYAPVEGGIPLWDASGNPISGDVTNMIRLWDAGTEADQEPGAGSNQAPRQSGPNTGPTDPDNTVRMASGFGNIPAVSSVIRVTITPMGDSKFMARIANVSGTGTLTSSAGPQPIPLSPGVYVVHAGDAPLFKAGEADRGLGIEGIAEDGNPENLMRNVRMMTGVGSPLSPGVFLVHSASGALFQAGQPDRGEGLERIAEEGNVADLNSALIAQYGTAMTGVFNTPMGASAPGPIGAGRAYEFTVMAEPGARLSFASMLGQSNDWFYGSYDNGIALWDTRGNPVSGDVTSQVVLWDAGTEVNQALGLGKDQGPRQAAPNTGAADPDNKIRMVQDPSGRTPAVSRVVRVTIMPEG